ncbi:MAG: hypothetical protein AB7N76_05145 [Planctomycetota bacterium]
MTPDLQKTLIDLAWTNLPLFAGIVMGAASGHYRLMAMQNSAMRYAALHNDNHQKVRQHFIGLVNGKEKFLKPDGEEVAGLVVTVRFYLAIAVLMFLVLFGDLLLVELVQPGAVVDKQIVKFVQLIAALVIYLGIWVRLKRAKHATWIKKADAEGNEEFFEVTGEKAEDGLATRGLKVEKDDQPNLVVWLIEGA